MPGLVRGVARTAVVAGTATAVSGRVARRQAVKYADKDAQIAASRGAGYAQGAQSVYEQQAPAPAPAAAPQADMIWTLFRLNTLNMKQFAMKTLQAKVLKGEKAYTDRPGSLLKEADLDVLVTAADLTDAARKVCRTVA